ncbi:MAG: glycosyltransferase [Candidatus Levybacteria bacterium]|nr:glycosyltransferase [Candidatus Levybacteria bacterium]
MKLSIIVVHYKVKDRLFECLRSIRNNNPKFKFEVLVVDNDEEKIIEKELKKSFPWVKYIKNSKNTGYGAGNNLGAKNANGELLMFLNPDTVILPNAFDSLIKFMEKNHEVGIVAPLLLDKNNIPYKFQGTKELTPLRGIFALSFLNRIFPNNPVSKKYWLFGWDKKDIKEVDVIPGTAFVIRKDVFNKVGGFDERFFLYFEEFDLCRKVKKLGYKIFINPNSKMIHFWGDSAKSIQTKKIFSDSRFLYFRKNFGILNAIIIHLITSFRKKHAVLGLILIAGGFLRLFRLDDLMMFFGDQGWFYLSARNIFLRGDVPLVGITSSHTWLHQGPLWTYILSIVLKIFNFNPLSGAYFTAIVGIFSVFIMYKVTSALFSEKVGLIAASIFAVSPLVVIHSRMSYHTSLIPLFTTLFIYFVYKWLRGNYKFFPFIIAVLAVLYNLELATAILSVIFFFLLIERYFRDRELIIKTLSWRNLLHSFFIFLLLMFPVLFYDVSHGFPQTIKFAGWIPYSFLKPFYSSANTFSFSGFDKMIEFFLNYLQRLIFLPNQIISNIIFIVSLGFFFVHYFNSIKTKKDNVSITTIFLFTMIPILVFLINKTPSEAYLPLLFPTIIILIAFMFDFFLKYKYLAYIGYPVLVIILILNSYSLINKNYLMGIRNGYGPEFSTRTAVAKEIVRQARGRDFVLKGEGRGSQFESFTMNYEYLTWWLGGKPVKKADLKFVIMEKDKEVFLKSSQRRL